ncbi:MAG: hypothetical protein ACHQZQ_04295 [SAR324 cluster bacterium]
MSEPVEVGFQAFVNDSPEEFGAIRATSSNGRKITVYVENAGEFIVPIDAVTMVGFGKVTFDCKKLDMKLRKAIGHAHDAETE